MKKNLLLLILLVFISCSNDPLSPYSIPIAKISVSPNQAIKDSANFTVDATGSYCQGVSNNELWVRINWDWKNDSSVWDKWKSLSEILTDHPTKLYTFDSSSHFPCSKIILLEVSNPNGISDTAYDTVIILQDL